MELFGPAVRTCIGHPDPVSHFSWSGGLENTYCKALCPALHDHPETNVFPVTCTEM